MAEAKDFEVPMELVRAIVMPDRLGMALVTSIHDLEPSHFEEASQYHVWRYSMMEEYHSIMKNDVWEIVPRPERKSVVTSHWIYKLNMLPMVVWINTRLILWRGGSHRLSELIMMRHLHRLLIILISDH